MIELQQDDLVSACGGRLLDGIEPYGERERFPERAVVDSREVKGGDLFFGLQGAKVHGSEFADQALRAGAWGVVVPAGTHDLTNEPGHGRVIEVEDPLVALGHLATRWREELNNGDCDVVGVTGSVGKTSTKDILACLVSEIRKVHASPENYNTEIGLPLAILSAEADAQCLVLEMAMRGAGQIKQLARIARPDLGLITNVGAVHVELLGTIEAVAEAKAELVAELSTDAVCVVPVSEEALEPHLRSDVRTVTFDGKGITDLGKTDTDDERHVDVSLAGYQIDEKGSSARFLVAGEEIELSFNFSHRYNLVNATAAVAAIYGLGLPLSELTEKRYDVSFSSLRGEEIELPNDVVVVNDCYNANPMSMHAAIDYLAEVAERRGSHRRVAVLGEMAELGSAASHRHQEIGHYASERGVNLLVAVGINNDEYAKGFGDGPELHLVEDADGAASLLPGLLKGGDAVLIKGSRSVGLERVAEGLA